MMRVHRLQLIVVMALALAAAGCGAARTYNRAESAARTGDWDGAVEFYYFDENTEKEADGPVGPNFENVKEYLDRIW